MAGELPIHHILDQTNGWALDLWAGVLVVAGPYDDGLPALREYVATL